MNKELSNAVAVFRRSPNLGDDEIHRAIVAAGVEPRLADRLIEFLPIAYCRLILANSGARFSDMFQRILPSGISEKRSFSSEPVWNAALAFARAEVKSGVSREDLLAVAARSAECHAANQLLQKG